jgi:hypothetical protein
VFPLWVSWAVGDHAALPLYKWRRLLFLPIFREW